MKKAFWGSGSRLEEREIIMRNKLHKLEKNCRSAAPHSNL
jgi:hypothetical protein